MTRTQVEQWRAFTHPSTCFTTISCPSCYDRRGQAREEARLFWLAVSIERTVDSERRSGQGLGLNADMSFLLDS